MKENYRPVSVLTIISKIVERCYADQLGIFFENKFSAFLSAYRRRYGCQSALLRMIELWRQALDQGHFVGAVAMDLSKAFDSVPHALLIAKLRAYGVGIKTCKLFSSYLNNRYQRVRLHGEKSEWENITRGFPQGSILGPLFFNIYFNDVFWFTEETDLSNFADDNISSFSDPEVSVIEKTLAKEVTLLLKWFKDNSLEANPTKFQALLCQSNHSGDVKMNVIIEDVSVSSTPSITSLGVIIDSHLKFSEHISLLCQKASQQVNAMQRMYRLLDQRSRLVTYNSFIKSNFNYCPVVWMFANKTDLKKLEGIQIRALRLVYRDFT